MLAADARLEWQPAYDRWAHHDMIGTAYGGPGAVNNPYPTAVYPFHNGGANCVFLDAHAKSTPGPLDASHFKRQ